MACMEPGKQFAGIARNMPIEEFGQFRSGDFPRRKMKSITRDMLRNGAELNKLKSSMLNEGITQPLQVTGGVVSSGHHRYVAAKELGFTHVPVNIWEK